MSKISALPAITSVQADDLLPVVDVHDTTQAPSGTTKRVTVSALRGTVTRAATVVVAASNSSAAGKAQADYVCTGTSSTGGDEVTVNAAIAALSGGNGGRVVLLEGTYWTTGPVTCDLDNVLLEGQGEGHQTLIAVPTSVVTPTGYARVIWGNTRTLQRSGLRNIYVQPQGSGTSIIAGSGHGVVFRSNAGRIENVIVQSSQNDGFRIGGCTNQSLAFTLQQTTGAPASGTSETWTVSTSTVNSLTLAKIVPAGYSGTPGNDDSLERILIFTSTAGTSTSITVTRGFDSTPQTHSAGDSIVPIDNIFEVFGVKNQAIFPGNDGFCVEASTYNSEFLRCIVGGAKSLGTPRGRHGIRHFGGQNKYLLCHPYYNQQDGIHLDTSIPGAASHVIIGGEYETNANAGMFLQNAQNVLISDVLFYGNFNQSINVTFSSVVAIRNIWSTFSSGASSPSFQHIFAGNCPELIIEGSQLVFGEQQAIQLGASVSGSIVSGCTITGLDATSPGATPVQLNGAQNVTISGNVFDRPLKEIGAADFNRIHNNRFLTTNGTGGAAITLAGAHSEKWDNANVSDTVQPTTGTYTAFGRDHVIADTSVVGGSLTITTPPAGGSGAFDVTRTDSLSANTVTVTAASGLTVNGGSSITLAPAVSSGGMPARYTFLLNGTNWVAASSAVLPLRDTYLRSSAIYGETVPRSSMLNTGIILASGTLQLSALALPKGAVIGHLQYGSSTGATTPSHWWMGLFDSSLNLLALTADQAAAAWGATVYQSLPIATIASGAASTFTTTYTGLYYTGIMMAAATPVTLIGAGHASAAVISQTPILNGTSNTGMTTPPAFPFTATAITAVSNLIYGAAAT